MADRDCDIRAGPAREERGDVRAQNLRARPPKVEARFAARQRPGRDTSRSNSQDTVLAGRDQALPEPGFRYSR